MSAAPRFDPLLWGCLALAAALRLPFLDHGLPEVPYVDAFRFVEEAKSLSLASGGWSPEDFMYPGLLKLCLAVIYGGFGVESKLWLHLIHRLLACACDLGVVATLYLMVRRLGGRYAALVAAASYALSIIAVTSARIETADAMLTLFLTGAMSIMTRERLRTIDFVFAGVLVGCAMGTKYSGVYGFAALAIGAVLFARAERRVPRALGLLSLAGALAAAVFVATTPWIFEFRDAYWLGMKVQAEAQRYGQIGHVQSSALDYLLSPVVTSEQPWLRSSLLWTMGPAWLVGFLAALIAALLGRFGPAPRAVALYLLAYYALAAGEGHAKLIRYLLPALPMCCALLGLGAERFLRAHGERRAAPALLVALATYAAWPSASYLIDASQPTSNALVRQWASAHFQEGDRVLLSPFYVDDLTALPIQVLHFKGAAQTQYRLDSIGVDTEERPLYRPELVEKMATAEVRFVVLNSYFERNLYDTEENRRFFPQSVAAYAAFRAELAQRADLVCYIPGAGRLGPDVLIYRLRW